MMDRSAVEWLASTAHWTASVRAVENQRPDRLFEDPWAETLAGEQGQAWIAGRPPESFVPIVLRTRYFDDFLLRAANEIGLRQVVMLAAGLDTRAYRLGWPSGLRLFELDQPAVLQEKQRLLDQAGAAPLCERRAIEVDLTLPWSAALNAAGFDRSSPCVWLLEGFLFYLPNESIEKILDEVTGLSVTGSWLGFDIINGQTLTHPLTKAWVEMQARSGAAWVGTMDDPLGFLAQRGWQAALSQAGAAEANHGRWPYPVIPPALPDFPHNWFVTAEKL
jgi:methyltransferase (TIGR00027 family)